MVTNCKIRTCISKQNCTCNALNLCSYDGVFYFLSDLFGTFSGLYCIVKNERLSSMPVTSIFKTWIKNERVHTWTEENAQQGPFTGLFAAATPNLAQLRVHSVEHVFDDLVSDRLQIIRHHGTTTSSK